MLETAEGSVMTPTRKYPHRAREMTRRESIEAILETTISANMEAYKFAMAALGVPPDTQPPPVAGGKLLQMRAAA